ncbi:MAG: dienelactone hydrolase family protein [Pseudomonadota bacterium]
MQSKIDGPYRAPANGQAPTKLIVFLHGVGANGDDLIGLADPLAGLFPHVGFISPNAPEAYDMAPVGYQWFSLADRDPQVMLRGIQASEPILSRFLDDQKEAHGLTDGDIALVGFSQGTMMSLYHAPRRAGQLAAVVGFSGALIGAETLKQDTVSRPPVLLVHGEADPVVPFAAMAMAAGALNIAGFDVQTLARPGLAHGIDPQGLEAAAKHLLAVL